MTASTTEPGADAGREHPSHQGIPSPLRGDISPPPGRGAGGGGNSAIELEVTAADRRVARYAAAAIVLTIAEAALPSPLPGVKPGLANIVTLVVLWRHGWREAAWVTLLRVLAGSLLVGQFLAPGFFLSLTGALLSLAVLAAASRLPRALFGPVSHSVLAAFAHIAGQLVLVRLWLVPHDGVFHLVPVFAGAALLFGIVNGLIAAKLMQESKP